MTYSKKPKVKKTYSPLTKSTFELTPEVLPETITPEVPAEPELITPEVPAEPELITPEVPVKPAPVVPPRPVTPPAPTGASVSLTTLVGDANNRSVTLTATPTPPNCIIHWAVSRSALPAGHKGGRGGALLRFGPGSMDPGTYNVACHVVNPVDKSTADATASFTLPRQPLHLRPPAP